MSWRKSWPKLNIYGINGNGECSKRKLTPDERSVWDDYLDLAQLSIIRGKICIASDIGYTLQQLSQILKTPEEIILHAEHNLLKLKMIQVDKNRVIIILNWKKYQSEYDRQLQYRVTSKGYKKRLQRDTDTDTDTDTEKKRINKEAPILPDFINSLKNNPAYTHIDIDTELNKMDAWFLLPKAKGRKKTKQFILNWINKIDKPLAINKAHRRI